ncbi:MAG: GNAT family N-acetyltransferase [Syntrophorhabdaceae bacterium]
MIKRVSRLIYSQQQMVFYDYLYDNPAYQEEICKEFVFRPLTSGDKEEFSAFLAAQRDSEPIFKPSFDLNEAMERLHNGEICYVCENMGRIIGYSWFTKTKKYIPELGVSINPGPQELYLYNSYVSKDNRRRNVLGGNINAPGTNFLQDGFSRVITCVMVWNKPSRAAVQKLNFKIVGRLTVGYLLTFRYKINTCKRITILNDSGPFEFYTKLWSKVYNGFTLLPAIQAQFKRDRKMDIQVESPRELPGVQDTERLAALGNNDESAWESDPRSTISTN